MGGQGTILRLIDVVLIILVGFVSIADLSEKSRISFPYTQQEAQEQTEEEERAIVSIIVTASQDNMRTEQRERLTQAGNFVRSSVDLPNPEYLINWRQGDVNESREALSSQELEQQLKDLIRTYGRTIEAVNVIPTESSPVNGTVAIYDITDRLGLPFPGVDLSGDVPTAEAAAAATITGGGEE